MAQCVNCKKSGFFLSVNSKGLCTNCENHFKFEINQKLRIVKESYNIVTKSKNIDTIISRCDLAIHHLNELSVYDNFDLVEINFSENAQKWSY